MTVKTVKTNSLEYAKRIKIITDSYVNGGLYIGLCTMNGELYSDITTRIVSVPHPFGYVLKDSEAEKFIKEQRLGTPTESVIACGFNRYRMYKFNV